MKILILGAGQVGSSVAHILVADQHDVTVVDTSENLLRDLQEKIDLATVCGQASHPDVLMRAGIEDAEMIVAVTSSDETNMVACLIASSLFNTPTKIARVRSGEYLAHPELFGRERLSVDVIISPEQAVTDHIRRLIEYPGALQVLDFADGRVRMVGMRAYYGGPLIGKELRHLPKDIPGVDARVAAIFRRGRAILPEGGTVIQAEDEVFFIAAKDHIRTVMAEFTRLDKPFKRLMFAGGGNIGLRMAKALERDYSVKLIERDAHRARTAEHQIQRTIVLHGDATDRDLLISEGIEDIDMFCAVTNDDEANVLSGMLAKRLGARKVLAIINRPAYVDLIESGPIDIAVSPAQATIGSLLAHIRRGDVTTVHALRGGAAEAMEAIAHGDRGSSQVVGRTLADIRLPDGVTIGALVRGEEVLMAHHDVVVRAEDHLILFLTDKKAARKVERLFQVGVTFL